MPAVIFSVLFLGFMALLLLPVSYASRRRAELSEYEARAAWKRVLEKQQGVRAVLDDLSGQVQRSIEAETRLRDRIAELTARIDADMASEQRTPESELIDQRSIALLENLCDVVEMQVNDGQHAYKNTVDALAAAQADRTNAMMKYGELTSGPTDDDASAANTPASPTAA